MQGYSIPVLGDVQEPEQYDLILKLDLTWSWPCFGGSDEEWPGDLQRALSAWITLWFYDEQNFTFIACLYSMYPFFLDFVSLLP